MKSLHPGLVHSSFVMEAEEPVRLDFAALHRFIDNRIEDQVCYSSKSGLRALLLRELESCQVVSFDIFDTALIRYVDHPADVFLHLERHAAFASYSFAMAVSHLRVQAERRARECVQKLIGSMEVNLLEIYQVFCDLNGISRDCAPLFVEAEEQVEMCLCVASPVIFDLYREAIAHNKKVIFVSDTYHDQAFLVKLLRANNYSVTEDCLFASSETRKSKQAGQLFPHVLSAIALKPAQVVHVGDHPISDHACARNLGIRAILHPYKSSSEHRTLVNVHSKGGQDERLAQQSFLRGMVRATEQAAEAAGRRDDFWWKFGYSSAGPLTVGACQWLQASLRADQIEHAYFMLRDGLLWHQVYQLLFEQDAQACSTSTLFTSRRACLLPVFEIAPLFSLISMLAGIGLRPVREYLDRLHLPSSAFEAEVRLSGFTSLDQLIDGRNETSRLMRFIMQTRVLEVLIARSRHEGVYLQRYLEQEGVLTKKRVALIDLGWTGTVHKSLHLLLSRLSPQTQAVGYYMATFPEASHAIVPGLEARSYLAHRGQPYSTYQVIQSFLNLFEFTFSSTEGSLLYFAESSSPALQAETAKPKVIPVLQPNERSAAECSHLDALHAGALAFAKDFKKASAGLSLASIPPEFASEQIFRVIQQPKHEEAMLLGEIQHCDNLGSSSKHLAARLRPGATPAEILKDFSGAHWKPGLLAMRTVEGAALRTLLWLHADRENI